MRGDMDFVLRVAPPHRFGTGYGVLNVITVKSGGSLCAATSFLRAEKGYKEATNGASLCNLL